MTLETLTAHIEQIPAIVAKLTELQTRQELIMSMIAVIPTRRTFGISDLARIHGCSTTTVRNRPWYQPNYGRSDYDHGLKWTLESMLAYLEKSPGEHKADYMRLSLDEKKRRVRRAS